MLLLSSNCHINLSLQPFMNAWNMPEIALIIDKGSHGEMHFMHLIIEQDKTMKDIETDAKFTRIYSIGIWGFRRRSQNGHVSDGHILTVIGMECPEWRIPQGNMRNHNISWPHNLHKGSPRVVQQILPILLPPYFTLSIDSPIMSCYQLNHQNKITQQPIPNQNSGLHALLRTQLDQIFSFFLKVTSWSKKQSNP